MGHAEVAQAPGQGGNGVQYPAVGGSGASGGVVGMGQGEVAGQAGGRLLDLTNAAAEADAEDQNEDQGGGHHDGLDKVGDGGRQETAHGGVGHNDHGGDNHGRHVVDPEEAGEQLAAGGKARGGVGHEENHDDHGGNAHQQMAAVPEPVFKEVGDGDAVAADLGIVAQPLGHDEPVQIGADSQAHGSPEGVADAGDIGQSRDAQQQPGGHIAGLGAHGSDVGAQLPAAQIELAGGVAGLGAPEDQIQHHGQIGHDGNDNTDSGIGHRLTLFLSRFHYYSRTDTRTQHRIKSVHF